MKKDCRCVCLEEAYWPKKVENHFQLQSGQIVTEYFVVFKTFVLLSRKVFCNKNHIKNSRFKNLNCLKKYICCLSNLFDIFLWRQEGLSKQQQQQQNYNIIILQTMWQDVFVFGSNLGWKRLFLIENCQV